MFLKAKIGFTVFSVYEMLAVLLLHSKSTCTDIFSAWFCNDSVMKYFVFCVVVPLSIFLIYMWVAEIVKAVRRRHSFFYQAKKKVGGIASDIKDTIKEEFKNADIESYLAALTMFGVRSYMNKHPEKKAAIDNFIKNMFGGIEVEAEIYEPKTKASRKPQTRKSKKK